MKSKQVHYHIFMSDIILVCMPTYHGPIEWLKKALDSVQKQTYADFECWIVKDGCSCGLTLGDESSNWRAGATCEDCDSRMKYLRSFCKDDLRFRCFALPINFGRFGSGPRNFALMNTVHEYIAYLDDDNWWEHNHLDVCYSKLKEEDFDFVFSGTITHNIEGCITGVRNNIDMLCFSNIDTSEILHKRRLLNDFGGWRKPIGGPLPGAGTDWDLVRRWVYGGANWAHTGVCTLNYLTHDRSERALQSEPIYYFSK